MSRASIADVHMRTRHLFGIQQNLTARKAIDSGGCRMFRRTPRRCCGERIMSGLAFF